MIEFKRVEKSYSKGKSIIQEAHFQIKQGDFVLVTGASGAGKSTLLKMLYKAEKPTKGEIFLFDKNIQRMRTKTVRRKIGIVFQDFDSYLLKHKTAYENIAYILAAQGKNPFKIKRMVMEALDKMGIADKAKHKPHALSGGEKQRLAIARAIANQPALLICDEPTGNLDSDSARSVMAHLEQQNAEGATIVMSTHNEELMKRAGKRILIVEEGQVREQTVPLAAHKGGS